MLTTIRIHPFLTLLALPLLFMLGCTSPSKQEIKSLIPVPSTCIEPIHFEEITIGTKQTVQASDFSGTTARAEWYPVKVKFSVKCLPGLDDREMPLEALFGTEEEKSRFQAERKSTIERQGSMKSFTKEYRLRKNEYNEWKAVER